jgi:hypothetical protein
MAEKSKGNQHHSSNAHSEAEEAGATVEVSDSITTTVLVGLAVAVLQPELLPGMAIGAAAMLAPKVLPNLGGALRPLVKTAVRAGYATANKAMEMAAEAGEQMQDIIAEARAEQGSSGTASRARRPARRAAAHARAQSEAKE